MSELQLRSEGSVRRERFLGQIVILLVTFIALACSICAQAYSVDIQLDGVSVKDTVQDTIIGRQVHLTAVVSGTTPSNVAWHIPGIAVKDYSANASNAEVTALSRVDLASNDLAFYWVDGGERRVVTFTAFADGVSASASVTFNVKRPTAAINIKTGSVSTNPTWGPDTLSFGSPAMPGISLCCTVEEPAGFTGGGTQWVQVIDHIARAVEYDDGSWRFLMGENVCDTNYPYLADSSANASPLLQILDDCRGVMVEDSISSTERYSMFLMYKPTGAAIWVPLKKIDWNWSGQAYKSDTGWILDNCTYLTNPESADCITLPTWSGNFTGLLWQE
jgi:hypothetical protein